MNIKNSYQTNPYTITEFKQNQINMKQKLTHLISISWYLYFISTKWEQASLTLNLNNQFKNYYFFLTSNLNYLNYKQNVISINKITLIACNNI
jgi:hypothetical protein